MKWYQGQTQGLDQGQELEQEEEEEVKRQEQGQGLGLEKLLEEFEEVLGHEEAEDCLLEEEMLNLARAEEEGLTLRVARELLEELVTGVLEGSEERRDPGEETMVEEAVENLEQEVEAMVFHCMDCDKTFKSERSLGDHRRWKHGVESTCHTCGKVFSSKMHLVQHVTAKHSLQPRHLCHLCAKVFQKKSHLADHIAICSKNSPRKKAHKDTKDKCTSCSKVFCSRQALNAHVAKKHCADKVPIIFATYFCKRRSIFQKCTKCSLTFTRRNILKNHMKLHSTEGMLQNFPCSTCSKKFTSKNVLAKHMKVAHPPQVASFQCALCDQKFPKKRGLNQHMRRVHSGKLFACAKCDKTFKSVSSRKEHFNKCKKGEVQAPVAYSELSGRAQRARRKKQKEDFKRDTAEWSSEDKARHLRSVVKDCPAFLNSYRSNPLNTEDLLDIIRDGGLNNSQCIKIMVVLNRKWPGCIVPRAREALSAHNRNLDHLFTLKEVRGEDALHFVDGKGEPLESRWVTYCHDLDTLLGAKELFEGEEEGDNVFGCDDGKKILKLIWNRVKRGKVGPKGKVGGGVKFCQILFSVAGVKESYHNIDVMWKLLQLNRQKGRLAFDLKMANMANGIQPGSATFPCVYAECRKESLAPALKKTSGWIQGPNRTLDSLVADHTRWLSETGGDRRALKHYHSQEFLPLLTCEAGQSNLVLVRVPIPPLHCIKLGPVNHLVKALKEVYPGLNDRLAALHLQLSEYHGGCYQGKQCTTILKNIEALEIPDEHEPFKTALVALRDLNEMAAKVSMMSGFLNKKLLLGCL